MINNRSLGRGLSGRKQKRRRDHHRPLDNTCRFTFTIYVDMNGYFIQTSCGFYFHRYHSKEKIKNLNLTSKHLPNDVTKCIKYMNNSYTSNGNMRNR